MQEELSSTLQSVEQGNQEKAIAQEANAQLQARVDELTLAARALTAEVNAARSQAAHAAQVKHYRLNMLDRILACRLCFVTFALQQQNYMIHRPQGQGLLANFFVWLPVWPAT